MDAIAILLMGLGLFLVYEAYKNPTPTPLTTAQSHIQAASSGASSTPAPA